VIARCNAGVPFAEVYFVSPARIAAIAASFTWSGVSKSGSPIVSGRTLRPAA